MKMLLVMNSDSVEGMYTPASWAKGKALFSSRSSSFGAGPRMSWKLSS